MMMNAHLIPFENERIKQGGKFFMQNTLMRSIDFMP